MDKVEMEVIKEASELLEYQAELQSVGNDLSEYGKSKLRDLMAKLGYHKLPPLRAVDIAGILNEYFPYIGAKDKRTTAIGKLLDLFEGKPPKEKRPFSVGAV